MTMFYDETVELYVLSVKYLYGQVQITNRLLIHVYIFKYCCFYISYTRDRHYICI